MDWPVLSTFVIELLDRVVVLIVIGLAWKVRKPVGESLLKLIKNGRLASITGPAGVRADISYLEETVTAAEIVTEPTEPKQLPTTSSSNGSSEVQARTRPQTSTRRSQVRLDSMQLLSGFKKELTRDNLSALKAIIEATSGSWALPAEPKKVEEALVRHAPVGAIIAGWSQLEEFLLDAGRRWDPTIAWIGRRRLNVYLQLLLNKKVLDPSMIESIERFRKLRNDAAHGEEITAEQAESYLEIRDRLIEVIKERVEKRRLEHVLGELGVNTANEIALGLSLPYEGSFSTKEMRRLAQWHAAARDKKINISEADVPMLIRSGALHDPDVTKALGLSANPDAKQPTS